MKNFLTYSIPHGRAKERSFSLVIPSVVAHGQVSSHLCGGRYLLPEPLDSFSGGEAQHGDERRGSASVSVSLEDVHIITPLRSKVDDFRATSRGDDTFNPTLYIIIIICILIFPCERG